MDDYLAKPFSARQLADILAQWIPPGGKDPGEPANPPPASMDGNCPVDWSRLAALGDIPADRESVRNLVSLFLRTTRSSLESLRTLRSAPDLPQARKTLHRLKGGCATMGARRMADLIQEMERTAEAGETGRLGAMLADLEEAFGDTARLLEERAG